MMLEKPKRTRRKTNSNMRIWILLAIRSSILLLLPKRTLGRKNRDSASPGTSCFYLNLALICLHSEEFTHVRNAPCLHFGAGWRNLHSFFGHPVNTLLRLPLPSFCPYSTSSPIFARGPLYTRSQARQWLDCGFCLFWLLSLFCYAFFCRLLYVSCSAGKEHCSPVFPGPCSVRCRVRC